jgi:hypothetical protein
MLKIFFYRGMGEAGVCLLLTWDVLGTKPRHGDHPRVVIQVQKGRLRNFLPRDDEDLRVRMFMSTAKAYIL